MAHFAKLNSDNIVIAIHVVDNNVLLDENGVEQESKGISYLQEIHGWLDWKQTSYNTAGGQHRLEGTPFRKNYAGIGFKYDSSKDAFIPPKPNFDSWVLNEDTCLWESPVGNPVPNDDYIQRWDEDNLRWIATDINNNSYVWNTTTLTWDAL